GYRMTPRAPQRRAHPYRTRAVRAPDRRPVARARPPSLRSRRLLDRRALRCRAAAVRRRTPRSRRALPRTPPHAPRRPCRATRCHRRGGSARRPSARSPPAARRSWTRRARQLGLNAALPHDRVAADANERKQVLDALTERADRARRADVVTVAALATERLGALVAHLDVAQAE